MDALKYTLYIACVDMCVVIATINKQVRIGV